MKLGSLLSLGALLASLTMMTGTTDAAAEIRCGKFGCYTKSGSSLQRVPGSARVASERQSTNWRTVLRDRRRALREAARKRAVKQATIATRAKAVAASAAPGAGVPVSELNVSTVPNLSRDGIRRVQQVLKDKGFDPGPANGVPGARMKDAVRTFQKRYGIASNGDVDNQNSPRTGRGGIGEPVKPIEASSSSGAREIVRRITFVIAVTLSPNR